MAFEAALLKGACSPYDWNLAEIMEVDAGDRTAHIWLWNNQYGSPNARMSRVWWKGGDEFHVEEEKYSPKSPGDPFHPFLDWVHWSRIWKMGVTLKRKRIPEDVQIRLAHRFTEFRRRARRSRKEKARKK